MQEPRDLRDSRRPFELEQAARGVLSALIEGRRRPLPAAVVLVAVAAAVAATLATLPAPTTDAPRVTPTPAELSSSLGVPRPTARADVVPTLPPPPPTATPDPVDLLAAVGLPRVVDRGPAPLRKPGARDPDPSSDHVAVVDGASGALLFQRNAHQRVPPASLTKIMTAVLGLEHGRLEDRVKVDVDAHTMVDSTVMGLEPWFDVTLEDLLNGLMLSSGNDAALAIGRHLSGSDEAFAKLMNAKARRLGLSCTRFANPHGLDEDGHFSCPADMVALARYAMQYPGFRKLAAARTYDIRRSNISYTLYNVNPLLAAYPGADGVKTGLSDGAGRSLVGTAVYNGQRVYVAFMRSGAGAAIDGSLLLDWAFSSFTWPRGEASR